MNDQSTYFLSLSSFFLWKDVTPLTLSWADLEADPALLEATQEYNPEWRYPTDCIVNMLVLVPSWFVEMLGSDEIAAP